VSGSTPARLARKGSSGSPLTAATMGAKRADANQPSGDRPLVLLLPPPPPSPAPMAEEGSPANVDDASAVAAAAGDAVAVAVAVASAPRQRPSRYLHAQFH